MKTGVFSKVKKFFLSNVMVLVCIIFLIIGACITPNFIAPSNLHAVLKQMAIVGLLAAGESIAIINGGIDASVGGILNTAVVVLAMSQNLPLPVALLITLIVCALFGLLNGTLVAYFKIAPFVTTLGVGTIGEGMALLLSDGRPIYMENHTEFFKWIGTGKIFGVSNMVLIFLAILIIGQLILSKTSMGMYWRAIGGNEGATYWSGINVKRYKLLGYMCSGILVGCAAVLAVARTSVADPVVGLGMNLDAMSGAVLGGTYMGGGGIGSVLGALLGAFILGLINNLFNLINVSAYFQYIAKGVIIVIAIIVGSRTIKDN